MKSLSRKWIFKTMIEMFQNIQPSCRSQSIIEYKNPYTFSVFKYLTNLNATTWKLSFLILAANPHLILYIKLYAHVIVRLVGTIN